MYFEIAKSCSYVYFCDVTFAKPILRQRQLLRMETIYSVNAALSNLFLAVTESTFIVLF